MQKEKQKGKELPQDFSAQLMRSVPPWTTQLLIPQNKTNWETCSIPKDYLLHVSDRT